MKCREYLVSMLRTNLWSFSFQCIYLQKPVKITFKFKFNFFQKHDSRPKQGSEILIKRSLTYYTNMRLLTFFWFSYSGTHVLPSKEKKERKSVAKLCPTRQSHGLQPSVCEGFSSQDYWSGLPLSPQRRSSNQESNLGSCISHIAGGFFFFTTASHQSAR